MSYCFNPHCSQPHNSDQQDLCTGCSSSLLLKDRYRGTKLLGKSQLALTLEVIDLVDSSDELNDLQGQQIQAEVNVNSSSLDTNSSNVSKSSINNSQQRVLKILLTDYPKAVSLFKQEAEILKQVNHPSIPKIALGGYFSFQPQWNDSSVHCLVIEKIAGLDLEQWLASNNNESIAEAMAQDWLKQLLDTLEQLHQQQYFHRDIKPANIILQPNGNLALIDFGAARKVTSTYLGKIGVQQGVTRIGTPGYIAPEQVDGAALPQSDFYALGRTLIHLLTGKHPQELTRDLDTGRLNWRDQALQVSSGFADLLDSLIAHLPGDRPVNIEAIRNALALAQKFPHRSIKHTLPKIRRSLPIWLGLIFLPFSLLGLFSLRDSLNQEITAKKVVSAPLCNNLSCVNRDPIDNKCDRNSLTVTSDTGNYQLEPDLLKAYRLEVRYSAICQAAWARTEAPPGSSHYIEERQGKKYGMAVVPVDQWQRHYADMAPGKNIEVRACAEPPRAEKKCTNFVQL